MQTHMLQLMHLYKTHLVTYTAYTHLKSPVCKYVRTHVRMYVSMYVCMHAFSYVYKTRNCQHANTILIKRTRRQKIGCYRKQMLVTAIGTNVYICGTY